MCAPFWKRSAVLGGLAVLLIGAELIPSNLRLMPLISEADVDFVPEVNSFIRQSGLSQPIRVFPPTSTVSRPMPDLEIKAPNLSAAWLTLFYRRSGQPFYGVANGIQYSLDRSIDYLNTRESAGLWNAATTLSESDLWRILERINTPLVLRLEKAELKDLRLLAAFDTRSNFRLDAYWLEKTIARAYLVSNVEVAPSHDVAMREFLRPDFPFWNSVILEDAGHRETRGMPAAGTATIERYSMKEVSCRVEARIPGYLVLLDSYYPGWKAFVDGKETKILRANYAFRAIEVPEGSHAVVFHYRCLPFCLGFTISLVTLVCCVVIALLARDTKQVLPEGSGP